MTPKGAGNCLIGELRNSVFRNTDRPRKVPPDRLELDSNFDFEKQFLQCKTCIYNYFLYINTTIIIYSMIMVKANFNFIYIKILQVAKHQKFTLPHDQRE